MFQASFLSVCSLSSFYSICWLLFFMSNDITGVIPKTSCDKLSNLSTTVWIVQSSNFKSVEPIILLLCFKPFVLIRSPQFFTNIFSPSWFSAGNGHLLGWVLAEKVFPTVPVLRILLLNVCPLHFSSLQLPGGFAISLSHGIWAKLLLKNLDVLCDSNKC